jgi:poly(3-hydroxybutyrate) depolymerase
MYTTHDPFAGHSASGALRHLWLPTFLMALVLPGCGEESASNTGSGGSTPAAGGVATSGGSPGVGGAATGGVATGGSSSGGAATGGGGPTGGVGATGSSTGGVGATGAGTGGTGPAGGTGPTGGVGATGSSTGGVGATGAGTGGTGPSGGAMTGGTGPSGGATTGGAPAGGAPTGGAMPGGSAGTGGVSEGGAPATGGGDATGGASTEGRSPGCGTEPTIASNQYNNGTTIPITAAGMQRRYILNVPPNYDNTHAYRLIIAWHELNGNDKEMYNNDYYHLLPLSDNSTIFVAPNGQNGGQPCSGTGVGDGGCGWPNSNDSDLALGDAVVAEIEENFCIDTNRIFATGWSYGGSMSYANACARSLSGGPPGYIRAIAVYSGAQLSGNCSPSNPVAYYASHGTGDSVLNYSMGLQLAQNFASANGCNWTEPTRATGSHVCTELTGCMDGYPLVFCSFNGDHTPDPSDGGGGSWEYQNVWDFFSQF